VCVIMPCVYGIYAWHICPSHVLYGVATISRLLKITGLFCKKALQKRLYSANETYNSKEPTTRSHPLPQSYTYGCVILPCVCVTCIHDINIAHMCYDPICHSHACVILTCVCVMYI